MVLTLLDLVKQKPVFDASEDKVFWLHNGYTLKNLRELRDALATMTNSQFNHHVTETRHDFSDWIRDVLNDEVLADDIQTATDRHQARAILEQHLNDWYESRHHA